jgi:AbrB family looped-hinge helix DNA binding protein
MMEATLSSKGQLVLPAKVRSQLRLVRGERLSIEVHDDSVVLRRVAERRRYRTAPHPVSGLPVMVAARPSRRKATAEEIARVAAELL